MFFIEKGCADYLAHVAQFPLKCIEYSNNKCRLYAKDMHSGEDRTERGQDREKQMSCGVLTLPLSPYVSVPHWL